MKLAIACHRFGYGGGMERYAMDLVKGLRQLGIRPVVFARSFDTDIPEYAFIEPVRIAVRALPGKLRDHYFSWRLRTLKAAHGVDLLIGCSRTAVSDVAICGGTHLGHLAHANRRPTRWDRWQIRLERAHYAQAHLVLAHSRMMADELRRYYDVPQARIRVLYPPVDVDTFSPVDAARRAELRRELGIPEGTTAFLFPSTGHERKGYPMLEACFGATDLPVSLLVAGRPVEPRSPKIRYVGYRQDIADCYRAADYTILASRYEPFGLVGPESVLCGTPTVLPRGIGSTEALSEEACLAFDVDAPASLADAVRRAESRTREGRARLASPLSHLSYAPDTRAHVEALLDLSATLRSPSEVS
ncbi:glycosyltransferase family 4 protein [Pigmentiphaga kullae]|uniref:Glycosyltransferase involved in cell wall biosynthesis n=1 Tax=Pigmentiphaga kullae TaxID=151784 RepID=A0A4Q7N8S0_9BURK|nr:glycosyltransferase family 4 protein [Pigmentiphaga kullae]RZS78463.1 glycosyltransferase involved in cell wall biosynthesis [Pigmentiphaga kullae]